MKTFFWHDEEGATAIEYAMLVSLLGLVIVASASSLGQALYNLMLTTVNAL